MISQSTQTAFERLLGRASTVEEVKNLLAIKRELGIADNDALWVFVLYNEAFFQRLVAAATAARAALEAEIAAARAALEAEMKAKSVQYRTKMLEDIRDAVADAAANGIQSAISKTVRNVNLRWMAICGGIFLTVLGGGFYVGREFGIRTTEKVKLDASYWDGYAHSCRDRKFCQPDPRGSAPR